jgi:hypothetical protein
MPSQSTLHDEATFRQRWSPRRIVPALGASWRFHGNPPDDLEELVRGRAARLTQSTGSGDRVALGIAIEPRDGMTWSARAAAGAARGVLPHHWRVIALGHRRPPFDELADLVGARELVRATRQSGLEPDLQRNWAWWLATGVIVVALGAFATFAGRLAQQPKLAVAATVGLVVAAAAAVLLQRIVGAQIVPLFGPAARRKAADALRRAPVDQHVEDEFQRTLADLLPTKSPRVVVIDDLGECDPRLRRLALDYISSAGGRIAEELWVVFERGQRPGRSAKRSAAEPLRAPHLSSLSADERFTLWRARQQPLTQEDKDELIRSLTRRAVERESSRRRLRAVGDVVRPEHADETTAREELRALLAGQPVATQRAFALLALAATVPEPAAIDGAALAEIVRGGKPTEREPMAKLLREWFPPEDRSAAAIGEAVKLVGTSLQPLLDELPSQGRQKRIIVARWHADVLCRHEDWDGAYAFPARDDGHAFWALYWRRALERGWSALAAERLSSHLRALHEPLRVRSARGKSVATALCNAAIDAVHASLALCVQGVTSDPEDGEPGLLEQARLLLAVPSGSPDRRLASALLSAAWRVYAFTGDPSILPLIRTIHADCTSAEGPPATDALIELYLAAQPDDAGTELAFTAREAEDGALLDHARIRGALLAELVHPLGAEPGISPVCSDAVDAAPRGVPSVVERALERVRENPARASLDHLTLSLALLCAMLQSRNGRLDPDVAEALRERVDVLAHTQLDAQANPAAPLDFLLGGLLRQLRATCATAAAVAGGEMARLDEGLADLETVHVLWHNLEYTELADLTAFTRNAANVLSGRRTTSNREEAQSADYLLGIGATVGEALHQVQADLLVGAARRSHSQAKAAVPLLQGARRAIAGRIGAAFTFELCRLVLKNAAWYQSPELDEILEYVSDPALAERGLVLIPDADAALHARRLLSAIRNPDSDCARRVRDAVRAAQRRVSDPATSDALNSELDLSVVKWQRGDAAEGTEEVLGRWRARVWPAGERRADVTSSELEVHALILTFALHTASERSESLLGDAIRLIDECDEAVPRYAFVQLAGQLVQALEAAGDGDERVRKPMQVMRDGIAAAVPDAYPETAASWYERLARHDPENAAAHRSEAAHWRALGPELEDERFEHYLMSGQVFEVFVYYAARYPEIAGGPLVGVGSNIPEPLVYGPGGDPVALSTAFVDFGRAIVAGGDDDARIPIEALASEHLPGLFTLLIERADLPGDVREMVRRHRRRFDRAEESRARSANAR